MVLLVFASEVLIDSTSRAAKYCRFKTRAERAQAMGADSQLSETSSVVSEAVEMREVPPYVRENRAGARRDKRFMDSAARPAAE